MTSTHDAAVASTTDDRGCPVTDYTFIGGRKPPLSFFAEQDEYQRASRPFLRSGEAQGYWVFTDHEVILEGLQHPELFTSDVIVPVDPDPPYMWRPIMLNPPEHTKWRKLLGSYFSPGRVEALEDAQRAFAAELIEGFRADGQCDFYKRFAEVFPTTIFLQILGLPVDKLDEFMVWEDKILHGTPESDPDRTIGFAAMQEVMGYFQGLIDEKRADPSKLADDIVSHAVEWKIDGEPVTDDEILSCMLLLFMAGLDTVASQLSYTLYHLATHPTDRKRLADEPELIPHAVEELMRAYPIVQTARKASGDFDFHGCPVKKGDMVAFPLAMAGRDPTNYERAGAVDLDAEQVRHISFGAGPHRCLGSHLARQEMIVALQEWHRLIPDYQIPDGAEILEHNGGVYSLESLPLTWQA